MIRADGISCFLRCTRRTPSPCSKSTWPGLKSFTLHPSELWGAQYRAYRLPRSVSAVPQRCRHRPCLRVRGSSSSFKTKNPKKEGLDFKLKCAALACIHFLTSNTIVESFICDGSLGLLSFVDPQGLMNETIVFKNLETIKKNKEKI